MVESTRPSPLPAIDRAMDSRVFTPGFSHAGRRPDGDFPEARWSALCQATELPEQAVTHRLYFSLKAAVNRLSATQSFVYPSAWKDAGCHANGELRSSWKSMRARRLAAGSAFNCRFSVHRFVPFRIARVAAPPIPAISPRCAGLLTLRLAAGALRNQRARLIFWTKLPATRRKGGVSLRRYASSIDRCHTLTKRKFQTNPRCVTQL